MTRTLVIGYGNPGRMDDGLGPAAAAAIAKLDLGGVTTTDNYQLVIEDAIDVAEHDVVWFVDATREGEGPCAIERIAPAFDVTFTSHVVSPQTILAIAAQQFGKMPDAFLVSIRGYEFDLAETLTERARENLALAVSHMRERIGAYAQAAR
jgi:hydrogenase maturation protease